MANRNGFEVMKRYLGRREKFYPDPENKEDFIELEPIYGDKAPEIFFLMARMDSGKADMSKALDKDVARVITEIVTYAVKKAIPYSPDQGTQIDYEASIKEFVNTYYFQLFQKIMEMNVPPQNAESQDALARAKAEIARAKQV